MSSERRKRQSMITCPESLRARLERERLLMNLSGSWQSVARILLADYLDIRERDRKIGADPNYDV